MTGRAIQGNISRVAVLARLQGGTIHNLRTVLPDPKGMQLQVVKRWLLLNAD